MGSFVTDQMEETLVRLQAVAPYDYAAAYHETYSGIHGLDPRRIASHAELIYGRSLALELWTKREAATTALRFAS